MTIKAISLVRVTLLSWDAPVTACLIFRWFTDTLSSVLPTVIF